MTVPTRTPGVLAFLNEKVFPVFLFTSMGAFSWAIRGSAGFGTIRGCVFVGLLLSSTWLFLSRKGVRGSRRYALGWLLLAMTVGIGIGGMRGWSQFPQWVKGTWHWFYPPAGPEHYIDINPAFGYTWIFIAGSAWAGIGAVFLAWTGSKKPLRIKDWLFRLDLGIGSGLVGYALFHAFPAVFLPRYNELRYDDYSICTECMDAYDDNLVSWVFFCMYCGFLAFEIIRKDWNNVKLISIVGIMAGLSWMIFMAIGTDVVFWRVWEASSGAGIGLSFGLAWLFFNKPLSVNHVDRLEQPFSKYPGSEKVIGVYGGIAFGLGWSLHQAIQGHLDVYWNIDTPTLNWVVLAPVAACTILVVHYWTLKLDARPFKQGEKNLREYDKVYLVLYLILRTFGFMVTGRLDNAWELGFFVFYAIQMAVEFTMLLSIFLFHLKK